MRHGKKFNHLSRKAAHRRAMLSNMACSLIQHKRIKTTLAKAKALRVYIEPLITKSKKDTTHSRRVVFSYLKQKDAITELFSDVAIKVADRPGGYTRILKLGNRLGDNAQMAFIELVDYNEGYITDKPKRRKARRGKKRSLEGTIINDKNALKNTDAIEGVPTEEVAVVEDSVAEEVSAEEVSAEEVSVVEDSAAEEVPTEDSVDEKLDTPTNKTKKEE